VLALLSSFLDMHNGLIALLTSEGDAEVLVGPAGAKPSRSAFSSGCRSG